MPPPDPSKLSKVVVHPLVLLSVVDHFNRMKKIGSMKRVVGVLLGSNRQGVLDVSNSFAGLNLHLVIYTMVAIDLLYCGYKSVKLQLENQASPSRTRPMVKCGCCNRLTAEEFCGGNLRM